jgi:phage terminase large subunit
MEITVSKTFQPLLDDSKRYLILCGGAGSGKTEFAARKVFYRCQREGGHRFLILRKVRSRVRESVLEVMLRVLAENNIPFTFNKTDRGLSWTAPNGKTNELLFDGLDDPEKIKSIKGLTSVWLEEMTEFTKEDFIQIDLRLREPGPGYHQIIGTFNPDEAQAPWIKERFFDHKDPQATVHVSTVKDNPIREVRERYALQLEALRDQDATMYSIYGLGVWAAAKGRIYSWDTVPLPTDMAFDEVWYGGDFGFSVDPAAVVKIHRKGNEYWLQEVLYQTGLTNADIAATLRDKGLTGNELTVWDSAEKKSIEELRRAGLCVVGADKGPESVKAGIDLLRSKTIHVVEGSSNLIDEARTYKWKMDGNGNPLPMPVKFRDHLLDAARYGITWDSFRVRPDVWRI